MDVTFLRRSTIDIIKLDLPFQEYKDEYRIFANNGDQVQLFRRAQIIKSCVNNAGKLLNRGRTYSTQEVLDLVLGVEPEPNLVVVL